jgi:hypothetical protein
VALCLAPVAKPRPGRANRRICTLRSAARHDVDQSTLTNELLQLGLPKEHSDSLRGPYQEKKEELRVQFSKTSLRLPRVEQLDWRVDYVVSSSKMADVESPSVSLKLVTDDGSSHTFDVSSDKFAVLYSGAPDYAALPCPAQAPRHLSLRSVYS